MNRVSDCVIMSTVPIIDLVTNLYIYSRILLSYYDHH